MAIVGFFTSVYLVENHYAGVEAGSVCDFSEYVSCSLVNNSSFSEVFNVPVAVFGCVWFLVFFLMTLKAMDSSEERLDLSMLFWAVVGLLSVIYFVVAEIILEALCPLCTVVHVIIVVMLLMLIRLYTLKKFEFIDLKLWAGLAIVLSLLVLVVFNVFGGPVENHTELAKCITENDVTMYGSFRCGVCAKTRSMFGDAFEHIVEIECHPQGEHSEWELCQEKQISGTPTWIKEVDGVEVAREIGFLSISELREFSGCLE